MLVDLFHWSLHEIDLTDIESLIPFVFRYPRWKQAQKPDQPRTRIAYADEMEL